MVNDIMDVYHLRENGGNMKKIFKDMIGKAFVIGAAVIITASASAYNAVTGFAQDITDSDINNENINIVEEEPDNNMAGTWGTCSWDVTDGVLTIGAGQAAGSTSSGLLGINRVPWSSYKPTITKTVFTGKVKFTENASLKNMFSGCVNMTSIEGINNLDVSNVSDMYGMFLGCTSLTSLDLSSFNLAKATDVSMMFSACSLTEVTLPANLGSDAIKTSFITELLSGMKDGAWKDVTAGKNYDSKPDTLIAAHKYTYVEKEEELKVSVVSKNNTNSVTFVASAAGGNGEYSYKFIVYNKTTKKWGLVQDYSSKNICNWTKGAAGDRNFYVDVKDSTGKTVRSEAVNINTTNDTTQSGTLAVTLKAGATDITVGSGLTLTANATGGIGTYTYKFIIYNPSTDQWYKLQDFSSKNTFTWTAGSAGNRQFYVDVKDSTGKVSRSRVVNVGVSKAQEIPLSVKFTASSDSNKVGENITFKALGSGGKGSYTYKFIVYNKNTNQWAKIQNFSTVNTCTWKAGSVAEREFYVYIKDSTGDVIRSKALKVTTTANAK